MDELAVIFGFIPISTPLFSKGLFMPVVGQLTTFYRREIALESWTAKRPKTPIFPDNHFYYNIYDKSNKCYDKSENGHKHDKTGLSAVQLPRRREEKLFQSRFLGATGHSHKGVRRFQPVNVDER
jgi:hypothetical protein